jgi:hypothetical protein
MQHPEPECQYKHLPWLEFANDGVEMVLLFHFHKRRHCNLFRAAFNIAKGEETAASSSPKVLSPL